MGTDDPQKGTIVKSVLVVCIGLGLAALYGASAQQRAAPQLEENTGGAVVSWIGAHSKIVERKFERIRSQEEWENLWHTHTGEGKKFKDPVYAFPPRIDFKRCEVVAFFRGRATNHDGEEMVSIAPGADGSVLLRFDSLGYQTAAPPGQVDHGVACEPFGIWVIDRTDKPIVIEENVQSLIGQPPKWNEQHRFEASKK
jgi:hypothetical protein